MNYLSQFEFEAVSFQKAAAVEGTRVVKTKTPGQIFKSVFATQFQ